MRVLLGPSQLLLHDGDDRDERRLLRGSMEIWDKTPQLDALLVPNAGGPGARKAGDWQPKEKYGTLSGRAAAADRAAYQAFRRKLLAACGIGAEVELIVEDDDGIQQRMFVLRWDEVDPQWFDGLWCAYTLPLVAPDPGKYPMSPLVGSVGVFTGDTWFRGYVDESGAWVRTYADEAAWVRTYQQAEPSGELPDVIQLVSDGDDVSERVTISVTGPLTQGEWFVTEESTGAQMWADLGLVAGQTLVFDSYAKTLTLNGSDVSDLMFGDWLRLPPGTSTWRLVAGSASNGFAEVSALPRYT